VGIANPLHVLTRRQIALISGLLKEKRIRDQEGAFVLEGAKFCCDLIRSNPHAIHSLILSPRYLRQEDSIRREARLKLAARQFSCSDTLFEKLSDVETHQGVLAVVRVPQWDEDHLLGQARVLGVYGDRLRDPSNVGVIVRTAAALNLTGVWLSADSADAYAPKAVRASAGTVSAFPIFRGAPAQVFAKYDCALYAAVVPAPDRVWLRDIQNIPRRLVLAVGNEGEGLSDDVIALSAVQYAIPLSNEVESLNVAATAAISMFHMKGLPTES